MNRLSCTILALTASLALSATPSPAGTLNKNRVSAGAEWIAHIDVEAIVASKLFKAAMDHAGEMHVNMEGLDEMKAQLGIDPREDIKDITVYGAGDPEKGDMVVVANTTGKVDEAVARLKAQMPIVELTLAGQTVLKIDQDGDETFFQVRPGKSTDDRVVILARSAENIGKAIEVLDGKAPNLSSSDSSLAKSTSPGAGSMLFAAAKGLPWMSEEDDDGNPASQLLRASDRLSLDMGEEGPNSYVSVLIGTNSADTARDVSGMLNGFMSMGRLALGHEAELADAKALMNDVKMTTTGNDVRIDLRHSTDDLIRISQKLAAFAEQHHGDDDHDDHDDHEGHDKDDHHHDHHAKPGSAATTQPSPR